jgi:tRNA threonylcarbamoyl adenosine modification protein (Sua5/YciO/YrdC/YwlC family)
VVLSLEKGLAGIIPTDSVYAFCCLANQKSGFETICAIRHLDPRTVMMSILCKDISQASDFFVQWPNAVYRILNKNLPGPFTFILESGHRAPSFLKNKRKTLGLRICDHPVVQTLMDRVDFPLLVSSVRSDDDIEEYYTDTDDIIKKFEKQVGFVIIESEPTAQMPSTVVDLTGDEPEVIREGRGDFMT